MTAQYISSICFGGFLLASTCVIGATYPSDVEINGRNLSLAELSSLESRLGAHIGSGNYLVDPQSGCWLNIATGWIGCIGDPNISLSRKVGERRH